MGKQKQARGKRGKNNNLPFYEKWYFWVIVVLAAAGLMAGGFAIGTAMQNDRPTNTTSTSGNNSTSTMAGGNTSTDAENKGSALDYTKYAGDYGEMLVKNGVLGETSRIAEFTLNSDGTCNDLSEKSSTCTWTIEKSQIVVKIVESDGEIDYDVFDVLSDGVLYENDDNIDYSYPADINRMADDGEFYGIIK